MADQNLILAWLHDAYAMELAIARFLEKQVEEARDEPVFREKFRQHLEQTRDHSERVRSCLGRLGGGRAHPGNVPVVDWVQHLTAGAGMDRVVKGALAAYALEHFEIASYKALLKAADAAGDPETAETCWKTLQQEEEMARFLDLNLPMAVSGLIKGVLTAAQRTGVAPG